ncbi:unnamed protein product [Lactuca saligna]|uniref:Uncharacterized protein n=1 Tax=Lactuca saligna TaxID=75948 RepID=A0AA35YSQ2_LACSI|nr:unnamed protein product [Lactuca saligna]
MVVDDTPPNSLGDNPISPPSINLPQPSHPPLRTPSPLPNSPLQSDAAKKGENNQGLSDQQMHMIIIALTLSQSEIQSLKEEGFLLRGVHDVGVGSSSTVIACDPSAPLPNKKIKLIFDLNELVEMWRLSIEEVREMMLEYNADVRQKNEARKEECLSAKLA